MGDVLGSIMMYFWVGGLWGLSITTLSLILPPWGLEKGWIELVFPFDTLRLSIKIHLNAFRIESQIQGKPKGKRCPCVIVVVGVGNAVLMSGNYSDLGTRCEQDEIQLFQRTWYWIQKVWVKLMLLHCFILFLRIHRFWSFHSYVNGRQIV